MYSLARNREAVVAVARVSVRYLILLATLHVYYPLRAAHLSARSPFPGITGERTESARNQSTDQEGGKERMKERKKGEKMCSKRKFPIRFSSVFLTERKKKVGGKRRSSYLEQKEKTLVRYRLANVSITARDKYRVKRGTPRVNSLRESRKFAENAVARAPPAPGLIDG